MGMNEPLTQADVQDLADVWYQKLDVHAPAAELLAMLADDELEMRFPEGTMRGHAGFGEWYDRVIRLFFDETHTVTQVALDPGANGLATVKVVVNWQAKVWDPPAPNSKWLGFDAYQTWQVRRDPNGQAVIVSYAVDELKPMPGSAAL
jgi:hypothetical protein